MDILKVTAALDAAARESDEQFADRLVLVYVSPGAGGLVMHRVTRGTHVLNQAGEKQDFKARIMAALDALWPELPKQTRAYLRIGVDFIANNSGLARMMGAGGSDDD